MLHFKVQPARPLLSPVKHWVQCCSTHITALRLYTYVLTYTHVMYKCHDCAVCVWNLHVCNFDPMHQHAPSQAVKLVIIMPRPYS